MGLPGTISNVKLKIFSNFYCFEFFLKWLVHFLKLKCRIKKIFLEKIISVFTLKKFFIFQDKGQLSLFTKPLKISLMLAWKIFSNHQTKSNLLYFNKKLKLSYFRGFCKDFYIIRKQIDMFCLFLVQKDFHIIREHIDALTLFAFLFFREISLSFSGILMLFVFFFFTTFIFFKKLPIPFASMLLFSVFFFFREILIAFTSLFCSISLFC